MFSLISTIDNNSNANNEILSSSSFKPRFITLKITLNPDFILVL